MATERQEAHGFVEMPDIMCDLYSSLFSSKIAYIPQPRELGFELKD